MKMFENGDSESERFDPLFTSSIKREKAGSNSFSQEEIVNDLIDIIVDDETLKKKLLLANVKNIKNGIYFEQVIDELKTLCISRGIEYTYNVAQTQTKFKRCVGICRNTLLKAKTALEIKRFQEDQEQDAWFNKLLSVVKTMDSC